MQCEEDPPRYAVTSCSEVTRPSCSALATSDRDARTRSIGRPVCFIVNACVWTRENVEAANYSSLAVMYWNQKVLSNVCSPTRERNEEPGVS